MSGVPDKATPLPRLRPELILIEGAPTAMGEPAWLIQDPLQHRYFQIDKPTYHIFSVWSECRTVEELLAQVAVLDEVTTPTCRFLDGKTFSVSRGLELFDRVEANPDSIEDLNPWVRDTVDPATGKRSLSIERGGERYSIADIVRSGAGARDNRGEFSRGLGERELGDLGIGFPPYHGLCRTTTVAEVE